MKRKRMVGEREVVWFLDIVGVFTLASVIALALFLKFILGLIPSCDYNTAYAAPIYCGRDTFGVIIAHYFVLFSAWSFPYILSVLYGLAATMLSLNAPKFFVLVGIIICYSIALLSLLRILFVRIILPLFDPENYSKNEQLASKVLPFAVLIPSFILFILEVITKLF